MKKILALILAALCLLALTCCKGRTGESSLSDGSRELTAEDMEEKLEKKVVRVLMDLPNEGVKSDQLTEAVASLPGYNTDFTMYLESVPREDPERSNFLTRIKTELMAGKGPDLFICDQNAYGVSGVSYDGGGVPFFNFPEKAMKNRMFLPLDEYIEKAEYMEWDKFLPVVMEAGRNEEGQQIIPMAFFFPVTIVEKEKYGLSGVEYPKTRMEMAESDNPAIRAASEERMPDYIGRVMEPGADEPMFTEEELLEFAKADWEMRKPVQPSDREALSGDEAAWQGQLFRKKTAWAEDPLHLNQEDVEYSIIPVRNRNDGVTANIAAFAAVNRNARYPDIAFKIIDYIMRTGSQQKNTLFSERVFCGMPVHMDVGSEEFPMEDGWYMSEANFKEYEAARSEITEARFLGPVDEAVWMIENYDPDVTKKSVHEQYVLIQMLLAES